MFITAFTSVRHFSLSWASSIQSIPPHPTFWRSILILFFHLRPGRFYCNYEWKMRCSWLGPYRRSIDGLFGGMKRKCSYVSVSLQALKAGVAEVIVIMLLYRVGSQICSNASEECAFSIIVFVSLTLSGHRNHWARSWQRFWLTEAMNLEEEVECVHI